MGKFFKNIIEPILGYVLICIFILSIISILAILGGGLMSFFGFRYDSIGKVIIYFILVAIIGFPIELLTKAFPKALKSFRIINTNIERFLFILLDTLGTAIVMAIVDYFMKSVSASDLAIFVISFIISIFSLDE